MNTRRPHRLGMTVAEAMDSVLWDYVPERERAPSGYTAGDFFDRFGWDRAPGDPQPADEETEQERPRGDNDRE